MFVLRRRQQLSTKSGPPSLILGNAQSHTQFFSCFIVTGTPVMLTCYQQSWLRDISGELTLLPVLTGYCRKLGWYVDAHEYAPEPRDIRLEESMKPRRILVLGLYLGLAGGCLAAAQNTPATATQPPAASSGSPAAKVGLFVYPQKNQTPQQQAQDESACYASAQQQTGIDPAAPPPPPQQAQQQKGGAVKGAAKGAAGGAAIGAIADDAGTGAAVGATAGAVRGGRQQKKANKQAEQQAQQQAQAQQQPGLDTFRRAFSACIDSKGYSVK
jgi:hypothetical protein